MQITISSDRENQNKIIEIDENSSVKDLLIKININPVTVIVSRDDNIILEDEKLKDKDNLKLISVISGG